MNRIWFAVAMLLLSSQWGLAEDISITRDDWTLKIAPDGEITSLADRNGRELVQPRLGANSLDVAVKPAYPAGGPEDWRPFSHPESEHLPHGAFFTWEPKRGGLRVQYRIELARGTLGTILTRTVTVTPTATIKSDVGVTLGNNLAPAREGRKTFVPRQNGIGEELSPDRRCIWTLNGGPNLQTLKPDVLAIPMISDSTPDGLRITHIADPLFTTSFTLASTSPPEASILPPAHAYLQWGYPGKVPLTDPVQRTFWTVIHSGSPEEAMKAWYATALADVPAGPDWLHDVALQHYDYLSHGGKGWFEDIDTFETLIPREDRDKVVLALHGWYDMLGRYTMNPETYKLDDEWTAFPRAPQVKDRFPTSESVKMTKAEVHRRIKYAKDRGFRVCLYFADGLASCDGAKDVFALDQVLNWGGWEGPDTLGKTYIQNPAHPEVYARYVNYMRALLAEYGNEIDAFVWDETFHARMGAGETGERPTYAAQAMMRLTRELTRMVSRKRPDLAFLTSDCIGATSDDKAPWIDVPPYAIMAHGTYQDSHSRPNVWPYGLFPNYRNVLWSCNWRAVTRFDFTEFGVKHYRTPVATSNGWLDDKGISRLTPEQRDAVMKLFNERKRVRQELKWLTGPAQFKP